MRLDHLVVAVRDLEAAMARSQELGFNVEAGGSHPGFGSRNSIIRFGLDYIELLAVEDEQKARSAAPGSLALVEYLERHEWGYLGFMVAGSSPEYYRQRLNDMGVETAAPWEMSRVRPDGHRLAWKLLQPGGLSWRRPWPTVIEWQTPDEQRLSWDGLGDHPNGARALSRIRLGARDSREAGAVYEHGFGLTCEDIEAPAELDASARQVFLDQGVVELLVPRPDTFGPVSRMLEDQGEGVFSASVQVPDIGQTEEWLVSQGIELVRRSSQTISLQNGGLFDGLEFAEADSH
jgi:hypothetical protein